MQFVSEKEKITIGKHLAQIKMNAQANMNPDVSHKLRIQSLSKIIEDIGTVAVLIGGPEFAFTIPMYESVLRAGMREMREDGGDTGNGV